MAEHRNQFTDAKRLFARLAHAFREAPNAAAARKLADVLESAYSRGPTQAADGESSQLLLDDLRMRTRALLDELARELPKDPDGRMQLLEIPVAQNIFEAIIADIR